MPEDQSRTIADLCEAVNVLNGQVAALIAYVAAVTDKPSEQVIREAQGVAQQMTAAPIILQPRTHPQRAASEGVEKILWASQKLSQP